MKKMKLYFAWLEDANPENSYWQQYDSLEDAVGENEGEEIFAAELKKLGVFKREVSLVRQKSKKKARKAKKVVSK